MKYRNKETGAIIDVACVVNSTAWEPVNPPKRVPAPVVEEPKAEKPKAKKPRSKKK